MKKVSLLTTLLTLLFVLTACGSPTSSVGSGSASTNSFRNGASRAGTGPLNPEAKLALGTIKLEGTKQAIDPKMAANLVPLWQLLYQLDSSTSAAPQEVTAVVDQIKATMTPVQVSTINSMSLTQADVFTAFQDQANGSGATGSGAAGFAGGGNRGGGPGGGFVFAGGGLGGGGGFGGGGFRGGGAGGSSTTTQTGSVLTAAQVAQARENAISTLLINQVIKLLQTKFSS